MSDLSSTQERGLALFARLLEAESRGKRTLSAGTQETFSWFNLEHAQAASTFAFRLAALVRSADDEISGLNTALAAAEREAVIGDTAMIRQALSLFVTHNQSGRKLIKPRTVVGAPGLFKRSPRRRRGGRFQISEGGASPQLDYWREDELANEHHEHWHQVYPFVGLPVRDFDQWVADTSLDQMVEILNVLQPDPSWRSQLEGATPSAIAVFFSDLMDQGFHQQLPPALRGLFNRPNDRHGELFVYMHAQMLARYDAELLSHSLARVEPFGPDQWAQSIAAGHNPIGLPFGRRRPGQILPSNLQDLLSDFMDPIEQALDSGRVFQADGSEVELNPVLLGEMLEAAAPWTTTLDTNLYRGLHNTGHGGLSSLAEFQSGVMASTVVAIRDPIFWRWHKHIDNLAASWQDDQTPNPLDDQPEVLVRNGIVHDTGSTPTPWVSPDIILVNTDALPPGQDPVELGESLFGGSSWDLDAGAVSGPGAEAITNQLTTMMMPRDTPDDPTTFLSHIPFGYYFRVENLSTQDKDITLRIFIAPSSIASDRRGWIEMDKFHTVIPAATRKVIFRGDTESSVVKKPAERSPGEVTTPGSSADENGYCDCGWPWTLLLPRGHALGMEFNLVAVCTDWNLDRVAEPDHCGSMSFCGALDRYPDQRDMGYPFNRPFDQPIENVFASLPGCGGRRFTIRHV